MLNLGQAADRVSHHEDRALDVAQVQDHGPLRTDREDRVRDHLTRGVEILRLGVAETRRIGHEPTRLSDMPEALRRAELQPLPTHLMWTHMIHRLFHSRNTEK